MLWLLRLLLLMTMKLMMDGYAAALRDNSIHLTMEEELPPSSVIGNVAESSGLIARYSDEILRKLKFRFISQPSCDIRIDESSGVLRVNERIDREASALLGGGGGRGDDLNVGCRVDVVVQPLIYFELIKVLIEIVDVNDNNPEFKNDWQTFEILESTRIGTTFPLPTAIDNDSSMYSVVDYRIVQSDDDDEYFQIVDSESLDIALKMVLIRELDRERRESHSLTLFAVDGGFPPRSGSVAVTVSVLDANDNAPVFERNDYELTIPENIDPSTTVMRLHSVDLDTGANARILYAFTESTADSHGSVFSVDNATGELVVIGEVDRETRSDYRLVVSAQNPGPDSVSSEAVLIVRVADLNDNRPSIAVNALSGSNVSSTAVAEDSAVGTFVAHVIIVDPDEGENARCSCSVDGDDGDDPKTAFLLHRIFDMEYQIVTAAVLDRETDSRHLVQIRCRDEGDRPLTSSMTLQVDVDDVNDNAPKFRSSAYSVDVFENNYLGIPLATVEASDADSGNNSAISYALQPNEFSPFFSIDARRGLLMGQHTFDHEATPRLHLIVLAIDAGSPPRTGSARVSVAILDVNDESPQFTSPAYSFGIEENLAAGYEVGHLRAEDRDDYPHNCFSFSFLPTGSGGYHAFRIDEKSGKITTTRSLDREEVGVYRLTARVRDDGAPSSLYSTASVTVYVMDVNDNQPMFSAASSDAKGVKNTVVVRIPKQTSAGSVIMQVSATDADEGENADVIYRLDGGDVDAFSIHPLHGTVVLTTDTLEADAEEGTVFTLSVIATDSGSPSMSCRMTLKVVVEEVPVIPKYRFISEQQSAIERNVVTFSVITLVAILTSILVVLIVYFCLVKTKRICVLRKTRS